MRDVADGDRGDWINDGGYSGHLIYTGAKAQASGPKANNRIQVIATHWTEVGALYQRSSLGTGSGDGAGAVIRSHHQAYAPPGSNDRGYWAIILRDDIFHRTPH